jgi:hypothetical protein
MTSKIFVGILIRCLTVCGLAFSSVASTITPSQAQTQAQTVSSDSSLSGTSPTNSVTANSVTANSVNWALLTKAQVTELQALNIKILAPQNIPKGYVVQQVLTEPCPSDAPCRFGPRYSIIYRNQAQDSCFTVEGVGGGIGGPPSLENSVRVLAGVLGTTDLHYGRYSVPEMRFTYPNELLYMDFTSGNLGKPPFYRVVGSIFTRQMYFQDLGKNDNEERPKICRNEVGLSEIVPVIQSLRYL